MWLKKVSDPQSMSPNYQHQYLSLTCLFQLSLAANQATSKLSDLKQSFYLLIILKIWTMFSWIVLPLVLLAVTHVRVKNKKKQYLSIIKKIVLTLHTIWKGLRDHLPKGPWNPLWEPLGNLFLILHFQTGLWLVWDKGHQLTLGKLSEVLRVLGELF